MTNQKTNPIVVKFWEAYKDLLPPGELSPTDEYQVWSFGNTPTMADDLAALVVQGKKRATTTLVWIFEVGLETYPEVGDYHIILDGQAQPVCIIQTIELTVKPFDEVDETYAALEGEGDGSLEYWREAHWSFFSDECQKLNREPDTKMLVLCEKFKLVYTK